ncbi:MAG: molybdopterin adenylyltransferase [Burkholderiales bacterium]|jgi:molybdopterin adenylyltransferase|nr:molybdopterin adenylyltransferase [Burkholderiales bacterium]
MSEQESVTIGLVSVSDRASKGVYRDEGLPALREWLERALLNPVRFEERLIPDEQPEIEAALKSLVDEAKCHLVLTTGGTGPAPRDVTPEATLAVGEKLMPGFGEQMRQISLKFVPTAILSRQVAVIRKGALIINLPGQPKSIRETLEGLRSSEGDQLVPGIFAAVPYCIDLIGGPYLETRPEVCKAFRPKSAIRPAKS